MIVSIIILAGCGGGSGGGGNAPSNNNTTNNVTSNPGITLVLPASASVAATVTIIGTNFVQTANNYSVSFNGVITTPILRTLTQLAVIVPVGATSGPLTVTDLVTNQIYTVPGGFNVLGTTRLMGGAIQGKALNLTTAVSTFAGSGLPGSADATGIAASFNGPYGVTTDGANLYIADMRNNKIRKVVIATGVVTTLAGSGLVGSVDATGLAASFNGPLGITTDGTSLYVAEAAGNKIRKIVIATGVVTTLAGSGLVGANDATGIAASFNSVTSITTDGTNLYATDWGNCTIRKIVIATGVVTTLAGTGFISAVDASGIAAGFYNPNGITTDGANLYVSDENNNKIRKIVIATGVVTTLAGSGVIGAVDAVGVAASFKWPSGITTDGTNLYVAEYGNHKIRKVAIATGAVSTLAGSGLAGAVDAVGIAASFSTPYGLTTDGTSVFVGDSGNNKIRKIQ